VVLSRRAAVLGLVVLAACSESLFGAHHAGQTSDGGGDDASAGPDSGVVPSTCPSGCLGDAGADFNGMAGGAGKHWRYLDDLRNRSWIPMTVGINEMIGTDPLNRITTCAAKPGASACNALPGALLVSTAGSKSGADPAIEFTAAADQVIQLSLHALVPAGGADQMIRLYRNSREDVLFTGTATAGTDLAHALTLTALAGDRFLVAVAPTGGGARAIGLQLFVNDMGAKFPATCQVALSFASATGNTTNDLCGHAVFSSYVTLPLPISLVGGPFTEQGNAADVSSGEYLVRSTTDTSSPLLDWTKDVTVQLWVEFKSFDPGSPAVLFSDLDRGSGSGIDISISPGTGNLDVQTCAPSSSGVMLGDAVFPYPYSSTTSPQWGFIRVVRAGGQVRVCVNGVFAVSADTGSCTAPSVYAPQIGKHASSVGAFLIGEIDDVRVITGALPCN